jgi:outer membrane lipoprotein-sorting protein
MMQLKTVSWLLCAVLTLSAPVLAQTVDEIIQKNLEAKGGEEAWMAVETARITGTMRMGGSAAGAIEAPFTIEFGRPDKVRVEFTMQGMTAVQAYDGTVGWSIMPFMGKTEPEVMAEDQLKQIKDQAELEGPLVNYKAKGHTVELLGEEEVDGTQAYKLKVTKANGDVDFLYLDKEYFVEFKSVSKREVQGTEVEIATVIGDYKEVGDLVLAHSMEIAYGGGPANQVLTITDVEFGVEIPDERFAMPAKTGGDEAAPE